MQAALLWGWGLGTVFSGTWNQPPPSPHLTVEVDRVSQPSASFSVFLVDPKRPPDLST